MASIGANYNRWLFNYIKITRFTVFVVQVRTPTFINIRMILDMRTLTHTLIFLPMIFLSFRNFLVLLILYCLKTYCYISDL